MVNCSQNRECVTGALVEQRKCETHAVNLCDYQLTLKAPGKTATKNVVCSCCVLHIFDNIIGKCRYRGKQCGPRSDCSYGLQEHSELDLHCLWKRLKIFQNILL